MNPQALGVASVFMFIIWMFLILCVVMLIPLIFYLITLQKALSRCAPQSRAMEPGLVWLQLIPIFNMVWQFFVVINVATSLHNEFVRRGIPQEQSPGQGIGMAMCILSVCSIIPLLGIPCALASFILWIIYWSKIAGFSGMIALPYEAPRPVAAA